MVKILDCLNAPEDEIQRYSIANETLNNLQSPVSNTFKAPRIESKDIIDLKEGECRGKVVKKSYMTMDVACKPYMLQRDDDSQEFHRQKGQLAILKGLRCRYVINFHGTSYVDGQNVLVYDWVDTGNLREYYKKLNIPWKTKLLIARDICHGLNALSYMGIHHHDVRCKNILVMHAPLNITRKHLF